MICKFKVVLGPNSKKFTDISRGINRNFYQNYNVKVLFLKMDKQIVNNTRESQQFVPNTQHALIRMTQSQQVRSNQAPAKQLLQILRYQRSTCSQWLSIHEVYQLGLKEGLLPKEIQDAIELLKVGGFLEKREDTVRAIPLN